MTPTSKERICPLVKRQDWTSHSDLQSKQDIMDIRSFEKNLLSRITLLIVDRKESMIWELKDDAKDTSYEAIGLSTYSNSKSIVLSYISIFENLWKQTELYEQVKEANERLKLQDKMQQEFINVAAPIQPILAAIGVLHSAKGHISEEQLDDSLDLIRRNARRLKRLAEDLLDVTKIESQSLKLNKERLNLNDVISSAVQEISREQIDSSSRKVQITFEPKGVDQDFIFIEVDRQRLTQVIINLLSNAVKFTKGDGGSISIGVQKTKAEHGHGQKVIKVSVRDTGTGIDPEIFPRLFEKFVSKSFQGTGLGLFITRNIIKAHGGKTWGVNNPDGKGATFTFSLPVS
jgi:signal transduction histidine kinase